MSAGGRWLCARVSSCSRRPGMSAMCCRSCGAVALTFVVAHLVPPSPRLSRDARGFSNGCINEQLYMAMADKMVADGYLAAGYNRVNIGSSGDAGCPRAHVRRLMLTRRRSHRRLLGQPQPRGRWIPASQRRPVPPRHQGTTAHVCRVPVVPCDAHRASRLGCRSPCAVARGLHARTRPQARHLR